jgi:hypothetical protein
MTRKHFAALLAVYLILVFSLISCSSPGPTSVLPQTSAAPGTSSSPTVEDAGPRFVITQSATPAFSPTTIAPTTVNITNITPMRDLTGTWMGKGVSYWIDGASGTRVARTTWHVTLIITHQQDSTVQGTLTMTTIAQENLGAANLPWENYGPDNITDGIISGTTLDFDVDVWHWTFTFTTDLMSGQYTTPDPGVPCDPKAFALTRQH